MRDLNEHLISALDLNLFQPLDLEIPQKSLRVRLKEEKVIHSFMSRLREGQQESKGDFWTGRRRRQQLGTHSKAAVEQICTADSAHSERQILGMIF